jgi:transposase
MTMTKSKSPEEFKLEVVNQVVERGYSVSDIAKLLGISVQSLYKWVKASSSNSVLSFMYF